MGGQHNEHTSFGRALEKIAGRPGVETVVEVGTWDGQGTTLQVAKGLASAPHKANPPRLVTVEADPAFFEKATLFWSRQASIPEHVHIDVALGRISTRFARWIDVKAHPGFDDRMKEWYETESALYHGSSPVPVSPPLDMVVLDGGEYTTTGDWEVLEQARPKFVAVNNANLFKGEKVYAALSESPNWEIVESDADNGIAWAIFERVAATPRAPPPAAEPAVSFASPPPPPPAAEPAEAAEPAFTAIDVPAEIGGEIEAVPFAGPVVIAWDDEDDGEPAAPIETREPGAPVEDGSAADPAGAVPPAAVEKKKRKAPVRRKPAKTATDAA